MDQTLGTVLYGTVIVFTPGTTKERAEAIVEYLRKQTAVLSIIPPQEFNPDFGGPVWYIP